jgi:hypothetical protein
VSGKLWLDGELPLKGQGPQLISALVPGPGTGLGTLLTKYLSKGAHFSSGTYSCSKWDLSHPAVSGVG